MKKLMDWSYSHPKHVIILLLGASVFFASFVPAVSVEMSARMLWSDGDPAITLYEDTLETFGAGNITVIFIKDRRLFTPDMLARLKEFQRALENIPYIDRVDSLFTFANLKGKDGVLHTAPFIAEVPETLEKALAIRAEALENPLAANNLISRDGSAIAFNLFLDDAVSPKEQKHFSMRMDEVIETISPQVETVFQIGRPYLSQMFYDSQVSDQRRIIPLSFLLFTLLSFLVWRSFQIVGLIIITSGLSVLWTIGFMGLFGLPMNGFTAIMPALLIAVGSTEDTHLFSEYLTGLLETGRSSKAISYMIDKISMPLFLTGLTTFLGFLAIALNKILILKQFGIVCAFGLFVNPLITFLIAPVYLRYCGPHKIDPTAGFSFGFVNAFFKVLARTITRMIHACKPRTFGVLTACSLVVGIFSLNITIDSNLTRAFKPSSPVRQSSRQLHEEIAGVGNFIIHISSKTASAFHHRENLAKIADIQAALRDRGWFDKTTSIVDYLALIHREMNDGDEAYERIPESSDMVAQYLLIMPHEQTAAFITNDASEASIVVRHHIQSSHAFMKIMEATDSILGRHLNAGFDFRTTGESVLSMKAAQTLVIGQVLSLSFTLLVIFLLMSLLFASVKTGVLALVPNVLPIVWLFGIMGLSGFSLDIGTSMVAVIAIGITVDDTIHFMTCYYSKMRIFQNRDKAIEACIRHEIRPIAATSVGLALAFGTLILSNLIPLIQFGFLAAAVMVFALITDLLIMPVILLSTTVSTKGLIFRESIQIREPK